MRKKERKIRTATKAAAVAPARECIDGQQVFRAVGFLSGKAEAAVQKGRNMELKHLFKRIAGMKKKKLASRGNEKPAKKEVLAYKNGRPYFKKT